MALHDAPHRRQADPGAGEIAAAVQSLEHAEQPIDEAHVETGAVVGHAKRTVLAFDHAAQFDPGNVAMGAVFPGVAQQISSTTRNRVGSPVTSRPGAMRTSTRRSGAWRCRSSIT
nr:hypothetical protein [Methylibium sp. T29-B]